MAARTAPVLAARPGRDALSARRALALVGLAEVLAMAVWFSAAAVLPSLERDWQLSSGAGSLLTAAVQVGFVAGSLLSAALNLPDHLEVRRLMAASALTAAIANVGLLAAGGLFAALPLRFAVGFFLAGVYPPGMKLVATYFRRGRGLAIGVVIGSLTLGSASPHLVRGLVDVRWQVVIVATSLLAALAAVLILPVRAGPAAEPAPPFDPRFALRALRARPLRLATFGYLGHMWELYALWAWLSAFVVASGVAAGAPTGRLATGLIAFATIGVSGIAGAVSAGWLADRVGRTAVTSGAMAVSGACCIVSVAAFGAPLPILLALLLPWGAAVIADSAQFSTAVTELADPRYAGSVLTLQTALGFALTVASIRLVPEVAQLVGWRFALAPLVAGPVLGTVAMLMLRRLPEARRMAHGRL